MLTEGDIEILRGLFESMRKSLAWELRASMGDLDKQDLDSSTNRRVYGPAIKIVRIGRAAEENNRPA